MEALPRFSGDDPTCSKCRHAEASTKWIEAYCLGKTVLNEEHLRRSCNRCGYTWAEALNKED